MRTQIIQISVVKKSFFWRPFAQDWLGSMNEKDVTYLCWDYNSSNTGNYIHVYNYTLNKSK